MEDLGDVAHARIVNRMPIITLNKRRLDTLPDKLQVFFFHHECAHHVLGHVFYPTQTSENEADCYAIKVGRREGYLSREDVESFSPYIAVSRGSAFGHLPAPCGRSVFWPASMIRPRKISPNRLGSSPRRRPCSPRVCADRASVALEKS